MIGYLRVNVYHKNKKLIIKAVKLMISQLLSVPIAGIIKLFLIKLVTKRGSQVRTRHWD